MPMALGTTNPAPRDPPSRWRRGPAVCFPRVQSRLRILLQVLGISGKRCNPYQAANTSHCGQDGDDQQGWENQCTSSDRRERRFRIMVYLDPLKQFAFQQAEQLAASDLA